MTNYSVSADMKREQQRKIDARYEEQKHANNKRESELKSSKTISSERKSSSCFELNRITRTDRQESLLNVRGSWRNIGGNDQNMRLQYRSSSEHQLSSHKIHIKHSKDESEANLTNYEDDNTDITGWR